MPLSQGSTFPGQKHMLKMPKKRQQVNCRKIREKCNAISTQMKARKYSLKPTKGRQTKFTKYLPLPGWYKNDTANTETHWSSKYKNMKTSRLYSKTSINVNDINSFSSHNENVIAIQDTLLLNK